MHDWLFCRCSDPDTTIFNECKLNSNNNTLDGEMFISGEAILKQTEPDMFPIWANLLGCLAFSLTLRLLGYLVLRYIKKPSRQQIK